MLSSAGVNEDNIMPQLSDDSIVNGYGRTLIEMCITHDLLIVNGRTTSLLLLSCHQTAFFHLSTHFLAFSLNF